MAKQPPPPGKTPAPEQGGGGDGTQFFAPEVGGYKRSDDTGPGAGMPPPPAEAPPQPLRRKSPVQPLPRTPAPQPPPAAAQPQQPPPPLQPQAQAPAQAPAPGPQPPAQPAAKPEPVDMSSAKDASKALADTVVGAFVDRLKAEAQAKGGHLTVHDLDNMQADFKRQAEALSGVFEQSFEVYVKAQERAAWDQQRNYPFDRLMVKKFSHLFKDGDKLGPDDISRRMLPGFFVALGMMLGPDVVEEYQEKCRAIVERVRGSGKGAFRWEKVYDNKEAKAVTLDAEIAIAGHFEDFDKRAGWFITVVNGHLTPVDPGGTDKAAAWELTPAGFAKFLDGMLSDLRADLDTDMGKMRITKRHGAETCANLFDILKRIKQ